MQGMGAKRTTLLSSRPALLDADVRQDDVAVPFVPLTHIHKVAGRDLSRREEMPLLLAADVLCG